MTVAPELFDPDHALLALKSYQKYLVGPLGVKTLDPGDSSYRGESPLSSSPLVLQLTVGE
jgi:glycogen debranching enzyme